MTGRPTDPLETSTSFGPLKDPRLERFCQEIVRGLRVEAAMEKAGYSPNSGNGTKILRRDYIKQRIEEIKLTGVSVAADAPPPSALDLPGRPREPTVSPSGFDIDLITPEWATREAAEAYIVAKTQRNVSAMVKLLELVLRLKGVDKRPIGRPRSNKEPNKGDVSDGKAKPDNPVDFAALVAGLSGDRDGVGAESEAEADADAEDASDSEEV